MKRFLIVLFNLTFFYGLLLAQRSWNQEANVGGDGRFHGVCLTIKGKAYIGLGENKNGTKLYDFWEFNPSTGFWTRKADYPGGGSYAATGFTVNNRGYVCFGANSNTPQSDIWEYVPESDKWVGKGNLFGEARYGASCFVIGDTAFIGTGSKGGPPYLRDMWMYVPSTNSWTKKSNFPGGDRHLATGFTLGTTGFMGTGLKSNSGASSDMYSYDKSQDSWTRIDDFPGSSMMGVISFVINKTAFVGTGYNLNSKFNNLYKYNYTNNTWSFVDSIPDELTSRHAAVGFSINNCGYLGTGQSATNIALKDFWSYCTNDTDIIPPVKNKNIGFSFYPSPVINILHIGTPGPEHETTVSLYNDIGQLIHYKKLFAEKIEIDLSKYSRTIYFVRCESGPAYAVKKILKQ